LDVPLVLLLDSKVHGLLYVQDSAFDGMAWNIGFTNGKHPMKHFGTE
jgi:hypothetical protein